MSHGTRTTATKSNKSPKSHAARRTQQPDRQPQSPRAMKKQPKKQPGTAREAGTGRSPLVSGADKGPNKLGQELSADMRNNILPRLRAMGVARVSVEYAGYGNTRAINYVEYFGPQNQPIDVTASWPACSHILERVVHTVLPEDFEAGQGGQGDVEINVEAGTLTVEHEENHVAVREITLEFAL